MSEDETNTAPEQPADESGAETETEREAGAPAEPAAEEAGATAEADALPVPPVEQSAVPEPAPQTWEQAPASRQGPLGHPRGVLFVILISIVTLGIYHLYWTFKVYEEMKRHTSEGLGGILGLVIALVIGIVNYFVIPSEVGKMYKGDGRAAPMTGWTGLWVILPLIGWIVWIVKVQGALNRYWKSKQAGPAAA